jgi:hypothetical protein
VLSSNDIFFLHFAVKFDKPKKKMETSSPDSFYKNVSMDLYPYMVREVSSLTLLSKAGVPNPFKVMDA